MNLLKISSLLLALSAHTALSAPVRYEISTDFATLFNFETSSLEADSGSISGFFIYDDDFNGVDAIRDFSFIVQRPEFGTVSEQTTVLGFSTGSVTVVAPEQETVGSYTNYGFSFLSPRLTCGSKSNVQDAIRLRPLPETLGTDTLIGIFTRTSGNAACTTIASSGNSNERFFVGSAVATVPLPATLPMLFTALAGLAWRFRRSGSHSV